MAENYRLRLGDGTILGVDHDGLRTWQLDDKAMVQVPGSHQWRPVRQVLAAAAPIREGGAAGREGPVPTRAPGGFTTLADSIEPSAREPSALGATATPAGDDGLPILRLKPLDPDELTPEVPESELTPLEETPAKAPPSIPPAVDVALRSVADIIEGLPEALTRSREVATPYAKAVVAASGAAAAPMKRHARPIAAGLAAVALVTLAAVAIVQRPSWLGFRARAAAPVPTVAAPLPPAPPEVAPAPLPRDVEVALEKLPHLALPTIQLVLARAGPDPASMFRRAHETAYYGASALPEAEARELRTLQDAVTSGLRGRDRQRVKAYGRMSPSRYLLVGEDARVMALFSRGVRALPPERRDRLQELFGKAIAAYYEPRPSATPGVAAP
jgi:hypothetical protein